MNNKLSSVQLCPAYLQQTIIIIYSHLISNLIGKIQNKNRQQNKQEQYNPYTVATASEIPVFLVIFLLSFLVFSYYGHCWFNIILSLTQSFKWCAMSTSIINSKGVIFEWLKALPPCLLQLNFFGMFQWVIICLKFNVTACLTPSLSSSITVYYYQ